MISSLKIKIFYFHVKKKNDPKKFKLYNGIKHCFALNEK